MRAILASAGLTLAVLVAPMSALADPRVGQPAPALAARAFDGRPMDLAALRGRVVVVNFWATWCAPCRIEMPAIDAVYRRHRAEGLEVLGMSQDRPGDRRRAISIMAPFAYPAALLDEARTDRFGPARQLPLTYVIDRAGVVRAILGRDGRPLTEEILEAAVRPLL